jgi:hypothetical protein
LSLLLPKISGKILQYFHAACDFRACQKVAGAPEVELGLFIDIVGEKGGVYNNVK